jgi:mannosyltransferase OCH1-like enzyme
MPKKVGGKVPPAVPGNPLLSAYYAAIKLEKQRKTPQWKLAAATASNPFMVIGKPAR